MSRVDPPAFLSPTSGLTPYCLQTAVVTVCATSCYVEFASITGIYSGIEHNGRQSCFIAGIAMYSTFERAYGTDRKLFSSGGTRPLVATPVTI
jgi:hypothetical protein